tara:strand:+ start:1549 stop:2040 length:492 start_codon:yes stop_codon:yes gene_type:complete
MISGLFAGHTHFLRFLVPFGQGGIGQQTRAEGAGIHDAHALFIEVGKQISEARILQVVVVIGQHNVHIDLVHDERKNFHRIARETNVSHFTCVADFLNRRKGLINNLLHFHKLDVVTENDVEMIHPHPVQADVDALSHALGGEIKMLQIIAAKLAAEDEFFPG